MITSTKVFDYETDPVRFLFIVDTGGAMRRVLTINILDVPEPPDCTADPQFSAGTGECCGSLRFLQQLSTATEAGDPFHVQTFGDF